MTLLLDTSAIIGWFERKNPNTVERVSADRATPMCHAVTFGELADGWQRAVAAGAAPEMVERRRFTFETVRDQFEVVCDLDPAAYAEVSLLARRALSHNDLWIAAAARTHSTTLLTEDADLAALDGLVVVGESLHVVRV